MISEKPEDLLRMSDAELRARSSEATHQHFKGGLYRLIGPVRDSVTGEPLQYKASGDPIIIYEHVYPEGRSLWARSKVEFNEFFKDGTPRFRKLIA